MKTESNYSRQNEDSEKEKIPMVNPGQDHHEGDIGTYQVSGKETEYTMLKHTFDSLKFDVDFQ